MAVRSRGTCPSSWAHIFIKDWDLGSDSWEGLVDIYVDDHPVVESLRRLAHEIDDLRDSRAEGPLEQFVARTVGVDYYPGPLTYKEWLGQIAGRLRLHADGIEQSRATEPPGTDHQ